MRDMTAEGIIESLQRDAETHAVRERKLTETRRSLDQVAASILEAKTVLHASIDEESKTRALS